MKQVLAAGIALLAILAGTGSATPAGAAVPNLHKTTKTTYSYGPNALQTVTAYIPKTQNGDTVVLVHGGGFHSSSGDASKLNTNAGSLAAYGDTVFVVNYRDDSGGVGIADQVADVVAGSEWVTTHAALLGANPALLSIVGGSSGGLLAGDAAELLNSLQSGTVKSVITLSGTMDFGTAFTYWRSLTGPLAQHHVTDLATVLGCTKAQHKHVKTYSCPTSLENKYSPDQTVTTSNCPARWIIFNGLTEEQPTAQAVGMDNALVAAGCPATLDLFPDSAHAFDYWSGVLGQIQDAIAAA